MNVLIAEDEPLAAERLIALLKQANEPFVLQGVLGSIEEVVTLLRSGVKPDLLFLDIELGDGKSFEILNQVTVEAPIIFTTAYDQYALQAFKHFSIDYLLKPVQLKDLEAALVKWRRLVIQPGGLHEQMHQLREWLSQEKPKPKARLLIKSGNKLQYKLVEDVAYFFANGKEVHIFTRIDNKKFLVDYTLEQLESILDKQKFFRISRKAIVNADAIGEVKGLISTRLEIKLNQACDHELNISRERAASFKAWLDG